MKTAGMFCVAAAAVGTATVLLFEHQAKTQLSERNRALREEVEELTQLKASQRPLSPLRLQAHGTSALPGEQWQELLRLRGELGVLRYEKIEASRLRADNTRLHSNWVEQLEGGKKLSLAQVEPYLEAKQRSADSLIAASQVTGDLTLLREALAKSPSDPKAAYAACFAWKQEATPEEQRERLEAFKQSAPDNALADYLSAQAHFKSGHTAEAIGELIAASGKPRFQDYHSELGAGVEEAYQAAGLSPLEAVRLAGAQPLPQLVELRGLGQSLGELAQRYQQAGDAASAQAAVQLGVALGRQVGEPAPGSTMIGELVGLAIERQTLESLAPTSPYDDSGRSVRDRLGELAQERAARQALLRQSEDRLRNLSGPDLASYYDRLRTAGESEALRWVVSQPQP